MLRRIARVPIAIALMSSLCCSTAPTVRAPAPTREETIQYLRESLVGYSWQTDEGASTYDSLTVIDCTLTVSERLTLPDHRIVYVDHILPLAKLTRSEFFADLIDGGSVGVYSLGAGRH